MAGKAARTVATGRDRRGRFVPGNHAGKWFMAGNTLGRRFPPGVSGNPGGKPGLRAGRRKWWERNEWRERVREAAEARREAAELVAKERAEQARRQAEAERGRQERKERDSARTPSERKRHRVSFDEVPRPAPPDTGPSIRDLVAAASEKLLSAGREEGERGPGNSPPPGAMV